MQATPARCRLSRGGLTSPDSSVKGLRSIAEMYRERGKKGGLWVTMNLLTESSTPQGEAQGGDIPWAFSLRKARDSPCRPAKTGSATPCQGAHQFYQHRWGPEPPATTTGGVNSQPDPEAKLKYLVGGPRVARW